ncbi:MAG: peptidase M24 [Nitrospinae bacterium CG11_big_fil_rev_8_21_14_0_20_56_8]|nr:MAG: peptidase M24 [Nitrospinae bacterium CG11_big_fil_rev_8_21_14_0_20_56_8]
MMALKKIYTGIFRDGGAGVRAKERYRKRRQEIMDREKRVMVLTGVPYGPGGETVWAYAHCPTYQEPAIMYLTGINQHQVVLLLDPLSKESREVLFLPRKDPAKEFWDGIRFGVGDPKSIREVRQVTGIQDVRDMDELKHVLKKRFLKTRPRQIGLLWMEGKVNGRAKNVTGDHNWKFKTRVHGWVRSWGAGKNPVSNIMKNHFDLRLPLDKFDVDNTQKAQDITATAFKETLKSFHSFKREYEVQGFLEGQMIMRSSYGLSFPSIIASGPNATVLHYMKNDDEFSKSELVLMDFGVRWMTMHADISRTVPASGRFNPMQRMLYEIVLNAQLQVEKGARPGGTIKELNAICWNAVNSGLEEKFKGLGGKWKLAYDYRPHGVSHLMGEQEHDGDPYRNYADQPMKPGWLISNEPGLYGKFRLRIGGKVYDEKIGIRIEDNLLITHDGCRNMSRKVPKSVRDIERLMKGEGK